MAAITPTSGLYKYRSWSNEYHKRVLTHNELYLASPSEFEDPFDCRIFPNLMKLTTEQEKRDYVTKMLIKHFKTLELNNLNLDTQMARMDYEIQHNLETYYRRFIDLYSQSQDLWYGVLSLSRVWDSPMMWAMYGEGRRGFSIGIYEGSFRNEKYFGKGGVTKYYKKQKFPDISPFEDYASIQNSFIETHSKHIDWKFEKEYRVTKTFFGQTRDQQQRKVYFKNEDVLEVIVGDLATPDTIREVRQLCSVKGWPLLQLKPELNSFNFSKVRID